MGKRLGDKVAFAREVRAVSLAVRYNHTQMLPIINAANSGITGTLFRITAALIMELIPLWDEITPCLFGFDE